MQKTYIVIQTWGRNRGGGGCHRIQWLQTITACLPPSTPSVLTTEQGVTKWCRLSWLTNSDPIYEPSPNAGGGGGVAGCQPMSTAVHRSPRRSNSIFNLCHRVGRVISFSPVVGIGTPPTPHPQAMCREGGTLTWFREEGHTRRRARGWDSPNSNEGTYTVVLFIYMYFVVLTLSYSSEINAVLCHQRVFLPLEEMLRYVRLCCPFSRE